jgi:ribosomal subunit interface protein
MGAGERHVEVVVRGRNVEVPDHFRQLVIDKLAKVERYDQKISRTDVELYHEKNRRQHGSCQHIEITCRTRGPVVRAEAFGSDFHQALELVLDKLERRFRTAADRRRIHHGRRTPTSLATATAQIVDSALVPVEDAEPADQDDLPGRVVRAKEHQAQPMTVDQALFEMELVGHDFFLFADVETGKATVVYRRHAYDYGLITLAG